MDRQSCGRVNPEGKKVYGDWGAPLSLRCPACRADNASDKRFCGDCGAALTRTGDVRTSAAARVPGLAAIQVAKPLSLQPAPCSSAERRQLTVMFCDIVGSTALAAELDPEDLREIIAEYRDRVAAVVRKFDGTISRYIGDGVLILFGHPSAHEDDAERAVRAALEIATGRHPPGAPAEPERRVRLGVATGVVIVGDLIGSEAAERQAVLGETPNLAARLQALAEPDGVVIAENTRRLIGGMFEYQDLGDVMLKGFAAPVRAWRVLGEGMAEGRFEALHAAELTPLVAREHELGLLNEYWRRARTGAGQVVLLAGEAGIGKSRLVAAFQERIEDEPHFRLRYFCSPHHQDSALHPFIAQLQRTAGFDREDTPAARLDKLRALLSPASPLHEDVAILAELLSIPTDDRYLPAALAPGQRKEKRFAALTRQLDGLAQRHPIMVVFEDAQWIDPSSREFLNRMVDRMAGLPVLLLITCRPEFHPVWTGKSHVSAMVLNRLDQSAGAALIRSVAGCQILPSEVTNEIAKRTDGVPLFVEELTKAVLEAGPLGVARGISGSPGPGFAVPSTLHASLMARLDRIGPAAKEVAQVGAAIGREFSYDLLTATAQLTHRELRPALDRLIGAGLVFRRGEPPDAKFLFKHALVQDAAYGTLLRGPRRELHARIARVLEARLAAGVHEAPELIAHHFMHAALPEQAIEYFRKAGERAVQHSANAEAIEHLTRALEALRSLAESTARQPLALELQALLTQVMIAMRGYAAPQTKEALLQAKAIMDGPTYSSAKFVILYGIWAASYVGGISAEQRLAANDFFAEAQKQNDAAPICIAHRALGTTLLSGGDFQGALQHLERAYALYDPKRHSDVRHQYGQDIGAAALCYRCWALWHLGYIDQATRIADAAVRRAEQVAHPHTMVYTICHARGFMDIFKHRSDGPQYWADQVVSLCLEHGFSHWMNCGRIFQGWAAVCRGDIDLGIQVLTAGIADWRGTGAQLWLPTFLALEAEAHAKLGRNEAALRCIERALTVSAKTGECWMKAELLRIKARLLFVSGKAASDQIEGLLVRSLNTARRQHARCYELRAARDLVHMQEGREGGDKARSQLRTVYNEFSEGFDTIDLQEAKALIQS